MDVTEISLAPTMIKMVASLIFQLSNDRRVPSPDSCLSSGTQRRMASHTGGWSGCSGNKKNEKRQQQSKNSPTAKSIKNSWVLGIKLHEECFFVTCLGHQGGPLAKSLIALPQLWPDTSPWLWWRFVVESYGCWAKCISHICSMYGPTGAICGMWSCIDIPCH